VVGGKTIRIKYVIKKLLSIPDGPFPNFPMPLIAENKGLQEKDTKADKSYLARERHKG
jgi:hypothetical protein